jgi:hypothetical protein
MKIDPPSPSLRRGKQFFSELKRRNVYKVKFGVPRALSSAFTRSGNSRFAANKMVGRAVRCPPPSGNPNGAHRSDAPLPNAIYAGQSAAFARNRAGRA